MLDERIQNAADVVRTALADTLPPPLEDLVGSDDHAPVYPAAGWRGPLVAVGTAVVVLLIAGATFLALRGDSASVTDTPEPTTTVPTTSAALAEVFDMRTDSLCEWFTAQDMNGIVAAAQQRAGTAYVLEEFNPDGCDSSPWDSQWNPDVEPQGKSHEWRTGMSSANGGRSVTVRIEPVDRKEGSPLAWSPLAFQIKSTPFAEHHLLDNGVSYQRRTYQFGWRDGWDGFVKVEGHADEILYFGLSVDDHDNGVYLTAEYEELSLAVVNELLRHMIWINSGA